ncbi:MAG: serine/threonine protein kinase [Gemmatimonadaceae bacterium]|nr:serine/threonine protein kinase [Gemmatimonadaceae bacterium]
MPDTTPLALPAGLESQFDMVRLLGKGGMGTVWLVRDRFLDRLVALKVLLEEHGDEPDRRARFLREARTSARLEHPHIIDVYRADETNGVVWFTMRFIDGESLGDRIRDRGPLPVAEGVRLLREVAWGLAYAHARGVVHRDIKPDNILLDRDSGRAVVTDFGIARDAVQGASNLTIDGHVLGSVHFMSPEQASDGALDGRSDLYALGCVAYLMFTGAVPFDGTPQSILVAHVTRPAPSMRAAAPHIPESVCAVIERCLAKDPAQRFATADLLAAALDNALRDAESAERAAADAAPGGVLSEVDALAIWQRAAQLQAEAAHRLERTAKLQTAPITDSASLDSGSYRVRDIEAAAVEAGISRQYVALALAERQAQPTSARPLIVSDRTDRQFTTMLGTSDRAISVSRVINASPKDTLAAIGVVFSGEPYKLEFKEALNGHPLDGGVLHFVAKRLSTSSGNPLAMMDRSNKLLHRLEQIELFDLHVTLQARGTGSTPQCEVVITGDLRKGLRRNLIADWSMIGGGAAISGVFAGSVAAGMGAAALSLLPGVIAGMGAAAAVMVWYRSLFRGALENAKTELGDLLGAVDRYFTKQTLFSFASPSVPALEPPQAPAPAPFAQRS